MSAADEALVRAYREAIYEFAAPDGPHRLVVDVVCPALDAVLVAAGAPAAARLTAANPGTEQPLADEVNAAANRRLADDLARRGLRWLDCWSDAPEGSWREEGFLVPGISRDDAEALARAYGQRGFLWCPRGRTVELVML